MRPDTVLANAKNVGLKSAGELLKGKKFRVPTFQRRYAWKLSNWKSQWSDLAKKDHRMGTLAVYEDQGEHIVVDGQQRLTTLMLILAAVRVVSFQNGDEKTVQKLDDIIFCNQKQKQYEQWLQ